MESSAVSGFFRVVKRPQTWLNVLFQWLAFPLGLFYFIFLVVGLSLGLGLLVVWVGIPILLVVAGAWWLFGSFERLQARYLLEADVATRAALLGDGGRRLGEAQGALRQRRHLARPRLPHGQAAVRHRVVHAVGDGGVGGRVARGLPGGLVLGLPSDQLG